MSESPQLIVTVEPPMQLVVEATGLPGPTGPTGPAGAEGFIVSPTEPIAPDGSVWFKTL